MHASSLFGLTQHGLEKALETAGVERYRSEQVFYWMYNRYVSSFQDMKNLPKALRTNLDLQYRIIHPEIIRDQRSADGTRKFLLRFHDGAAVESVLIPSDSRSEGSKNRLTLCLSTQVGCALGCVFCATGLMKLTRNLDAGEIVGQQLAIQQQTGESITNLVFMGMGEPLHNYDAVMDAMDILSHEKACAVSFRHITISTAGLVPAIKRLTAEGRKMKLAISLHATTDAQRTTLMPINARYPIKQLTEVLEDYYRVLRRRVTFEYILFDGFNDGEADANRLSTLTRRIPGKVNLIPFHSIDHGLALPGSLALKPASPASLARFAERLRSRGTTVIVRGSSGQDIDAACGQLVLRHGA